MRVYSGGTYDLFHAGHVEILRKLKMMAGENGKVIVAINTDEFVEKFKGKKPVMSTEDRVAVVSACRYVDEVVINESGEDSKPTILKVKPDIVIAGTDWADRDYMKQMGFTTEWLEEHQIGFGFLPYTRRISTTKLKQTIRQVE